VLNAQTALFDTKAKLAKARYDILPMLYAPARGVELPARTFAPKLPLPAEREDWEQAAHAAIEFWKMAAADERISTGFRAICVGNAAMLRKLMSR
jgi:hypothetical protein